MKSLVRGIRRFGWVSIPTTLLLLALFSCHQQPPKDEGDESPPAVAAGPPFFEEMTAASALHFTYRNGEEAGHYAILESLGGGVALLDYDGDGLLDIFVPGGGYFDGPDKKQIKGYPCRLYKNLGHWKFRDVTEEVGLTQPGFYSHGAAVGDYDRDGFLDLLVTGYGGVALYHNVAGPDGKRRFVEVTRQAGLTDKIHWASSAAFADLDGDGFPDLYICQYVDWSWENNPHCKYTREIPRDICSPRSFQANPHFLYRNTGKGTFENVTRSAGIRIDREDKAYGKGLGVLMVDVNDDGRPDIYVANDTTDKFLYINESTPGKIQLREDGLKMGVATDDKANANGSMGLDAADIDGSGLPALWVTNFEQELYGLYQMRKGNTKRFNYRTQAAGIASVGNTYVGWGTAFLDLDNDGWMDIVVANGHVIRHPPRDNLRQKPVLFHNQGGGLFTNATTQGGPYFQQPHRGRGLAAGDLDNDGRPDVVISHVNEPVSLLRNICASKNHWLGVELAGEGHRDTAGAKLTLAVGTKVLTQFKRGGGSYASANDPRLLFGLGPAVQTGRLTVYWPTGTPRVEHWEGLASDRYHRLVQGSGQP